MKNEEAYRLIRTAGLLAIIPIVLATGPLGGYLVADLLVNRFGLPGYTIAICVVLGFAAGVRETIRIIRIVLSSKE